ncbi:MAG: ATP synthase F1 subunit epsilon [Bacteroidetes bacterium]|jgi:F-type H+-transporting ATPase subunit epsilon|nr:ATP synthase F1 subunit epsilon [Bacteroidota bacterium]
MHIEIISPEGKVYEGEAVSVELPGTRGRFQVLKGHAAIMSSLAPGQVVVRTQAGEERFAVSGGVAEVKHDRVVVLT